ncbi:MAG TPA: succinate--CoA ligase subunit alpha [Candidatus Lokiarchaeia archaeon]|nr:succinate--CoA ligase subunit alpha [Candidatus Lokiarchaeia archaeon]
MYISENSRVIVQGTGQQGAFHAKLMLDYGTNIVAGVNPNKGGEEMHGVPIYNRVTEAIEEQGADTSIVFVPAQFAYGAVAESLNAGIQMTCIITEHVPIYDMVRLVERAKRKDLHLMGPNCPGMLIPDKIKLGIMPGDLCHFGNVVIISKSGTLSYEVTKAVGDAGIGVYAFVGIGGDPVRGTTMLEAVQHYADDANVKGIVLIGEIGSDEEEKTAQFIADSRLDIPIVAYIAGKNAPEGKRMGHAGAIISGNVGTAQGKIAALQRVGASIADTPWDVPILIKDVL